MRKFGIRMLLTAKRLIKRPLYLFLLLLMPTVTFALSGMQEKESGGIRALICLSEDAGHTEANGQRNAEKEEMESAAQRVARTLTKNEGTSVISFAVAGSEEKLKQAVQRGEADCGYVLPGNLGELLQSGEWKRSVQLYCGEDNSMVSLVNELVYAAVFREFSTQAYTAYAGDQFAESAGGVAAAKQQAEELLNLHLTDGSTFRFSYYGRLPDAGEVLEAQGQERTGMPEQGADLSAGVVPVRGMLALFIMLCGFCGLIDYKKDRESGRFVWLKNKLALQIQMVVLPAGGAAIVSLLCLAATGRMNGLGQEITNVILYILLLTAYVAVWGVLFRSEHAVVASMPFLMMGTILFSPIFWNLNAVLPVFGAMGRLFPVTWYLGM